MIRQNVDALKLFRELIIVMQEDEELPRFSLLDGVLLLILAEHPGASKTDLLEVLYGFRGEKRSSLDRPLYRLSKYGLIERAEFPLAATRKGEPRTAYKVSKAGDKFLQKCAVKIGA